MTNYLIPSRFHHDVQPFSGVLTSQCNVCGMTSRAVSEGERSQWELTHANYTCSNYEVDFGRSIANEEGLATATAWDLIHDPDEASAWEHYSEEDQGTWYDSLSMGMEIT